MSITSIYWYEFSKPLQINVQGSSLIPRPDSVVRLVSGDDSMTRLIILLVARNDTTRVCLGEKKDWQLISHDVNFYETMNDLFHFETNPRICKIFAGFHGKFQSTTIRMLNAMTKVTFLLFYYFVEKISSQYLHVTTQKMSSISSLLSTFFFYFSFQ